MKGQINGLQHIGIGTTNLVSTWKWMKEYFGYDIPMFDSVAEAPLMDLYTNNKTVNKRAAMIYNLQGGTAIELVELRSTTPRKPDFEVQLGDLGIFNCQIKVCSDRFNDVANEFIKAELFQTSDILQDGLGRRILNLSSPENLHFQLIESDDFFKKGTQNTAGVCGCSIGCSDIDKSKKFYAALGYDEVILETEGVFDDLKGFPGGDSQFKRSILQQKHPIKGAFSKIIGTTQIELLQVQDRTPKPIFKDRIWGDPGFIHLGFDVRGMKQIEKQLGYSGYNFTCDSSDQHHMGKTHVHCTYLEDPDGTLIEFTEVYKMPIIEKMGIFLRLSSRNPDKSIPSWLLKMSRFARIKDNYWERNPK